MSGFSSGRINPLAATKFLQVDLLHAGHMPEGRRVRPARATEGFANMQSSRSLEAVGATKHGTLVNLRPNPKNVLPFATLTRKRKKQKTCVCSKFIKFCKMSWNHLFRQVKSWPGRQGLFDILGNMNARK